MVCPIRFQDDGFTQTKGALVFSCDMCSLHESTKGNITSNLTCRRRLLKLIPFIDTSTSSVKFHTDKHVFTISAKAFGLLKEFVDKLGRVDRILGRVAQEYPEVEKQLYSDPLLAIESIEKYLRTKDSESLHKLYSVLKQTRLYKESRAFPRSTQNTPRTVNYELLLEFQTQPRLLHDKPDVENEGVILDCYKVGPFEIRIIELPGETLEKFYKVVTNLEDTLLTQIARFLVAQPNYSISDDPRLLKLDEVLTRRIQDFGRYLSSSFNELSRAEQTNLAVFATAQSLDLTKTFPLLLDDEVQEFYLDRPGDAFYLDHAQWGRCRTNLAPVPSELARLVTRLRLESRRPLDEMTPSLKTELKTNLFHVRAAVDIPPLAYDGLHLNVRKLRLRLLTLPELISSGTLTIQAAAFLILCMTLRLNITICGEPSSGKTTLANAINLTTPSFWRQITIEDALESVSTDVWGRHKVTFKVDPFDSLEEKRHTKSNEIIRLLHRSPDWVFLGEIQTAEHSAAMFHAISAGIRGIQTCHASSNDDLLLRWQIHHKIPEVCFHSLGLLIHMVRELSYGRIIRRVAQISEINIQSDKPSLLTLFEWNKQSGRLEQLQNDVLTPLIARTCKYERITDTDIRERFSIYKTTLENLLKEHDYNATAVAEAFEKVHRHLLSDARVKSEPRTAPSMVGGGILRRSQTSR